MNPKVETKVTKTLGINTDANVPNMKLPSLTNLTQEVH